MGITAAAAHRVDAAAVARLGFVGIEVEQRDGDRSVAGALRRGGLMGIAERVTDAAADLTDAADALPGTEGGPLAVVVLPAALPLQPGPVAVLSPVGVVSAYELYVAAAVAAASGRRVEHLNARRTLASATHSGVGGRVLARAAAPAWHELAFSSPEHSLRELVTRPAAIVVAVPPGSTEAAGLIAEHPDADIYLVFDRAHAQHGSVVAEQVAAMVELAFSLAAPPPAQPTAREALHSETPVGPEAEDDLPPIRASDVIHLRLTTTALELTNRTLQRLALRVALGSASEPDAARAVFACELTPGATRRESIKGVTGIAGLKPPGAVMRHWSHESEEVYEGGELRVLKFHVAVLDAAGDVHAEDAYRPGNGLDFFVTARDLTTLMRRPVGPSVLPAPVAREDSDVAAVDVLSGLSTALDVGAGVLATRTTDL